MIHARRAGFGRIGSNPSAKAQDRVPRVALGSRARVSALATAATPVPHVTCVRFARPMGVWLFRVGCRFLARIGDLVWGACATTPVFRGMCAPAPKRSRPARGAWVPRPPSYRACVPQPPNEPCLPARARSSDGAGRVSRAVGCVTWSWRRPAAVAGQKPRAGMTDRDVPWSGLVEGEEDARERER
jgi:hypothetical protein